MKNINTSASVPVLYRPILYCTTPDMENKYMYTKQRKVLLDCGISFVTGAHAAITGLIRLNDNTPNSHGHQIFAVNVLNSVLLKDTTFVPKVHQNAGFCI